MKILVTGSSGLIGSEVCTYFSKKGNIIHGIDNNQRAVFFGTQGDTSWRLKELCNILPSFTHHDIDIRNRSKIVDLLQIIKPDAVVHAAAQPSHDKAASIPFEDFDINATGTLNLLEATRQACPDAPFVHMSTNKVYGDAPNNIKLVELETRWDFADSKYKSGISENFSIDQSKHSLFGASKVAADIMVQEYGRYFGMHTCTLRGGCLTGPYHSGVELHGFLNYLIKCNLTGDTYKIFGYRGKQVRDNIHAEDVTRFIECFLKKPKMGEVYNIGGGKENSCSIIEAFKLCEDISGKKQKFVYIDQNRMGDHVCYYSDLSKIKSHYPNFSITKNLNGIFKETIEKTNFY
jgi:CDP-paratose 2-epimerase